jgi:heat shock protein HslJ
MRVRLLIGLLFALAVVAACDPAASPPSGSGLPASAFVGPRWTAIAIGAQQPVPGHEPSIQFGSGRVQGNGGCNGFSGTFRYDEGTGAAAFDGLAMTAMGCLDPRIGIVETAFSNILSRADRIALDADGRLHLSGPAGEVVLAKDLEG